MDGLSVEKVKMWFNLFRLYIYSILFYASQAINIHPCWCLLNNTTVEPLHRVIAVPGSRLHNGDTLSFCNIFVIVRLSFMPALTVISITNALLLYVR